MTAEPLETVTPAGGGSPDTDVRRLAELARAAVDRTGLDLSGAVVLTEAATGAYAVTCALAALARAERVYALGRPSCHGSLEQAWAETAALARALGLERRLTFLPSRTREAVGRADIVTNSGHVRPIDAELVGWMKPTAVVPLMYEAWERRPGDVDVAACAARGIAVGGTNERHPAIDVFSWLGAMARRLLGDAGLTIVGARVLLLSDNAFAPFLADGLRQAGAQVDVRPSLAAAAGPCGYDVLLVARRPQAAPLATEDARIIAERWAGASVVQFLGDVDRAAFARARVPVWPMVAPKPGHMAVLPSAVAPEPVVRLQAGGLKVGEILWRARHAGRSPAESLAVLSASGYGTPV